MRSSPRTPPGVATPREKEGQEELCLAFFDCSRSAAAMTRPVCLGRVYFVTVSVSVVECAADPDGPVPVSVMG
jgi:hypothetical protein